MSCLCWAQEWQMTVIRHFSGSELICPLYLQLAGWPLQAKQSCLPHSRSKWEELRGCVAPNHCFVCKEQTTNNSHSWKSVNTLCCFPLFPWQHLLIHVGFSWMFSCCLSFWDLTKAGHLWRSCCFLTEKSMVNKFLPRLKERGRGAARAVRQRERKKAEKLSADNVQPSEIMNGFKIAKQLFCEDRNERFTKQNTSLFKQRVQEEFSPIQYLRRKKFVPFQWSYYYAYMQLFNDNNLAVIGNRLFSLLLFSPIPLCPLPLSQDYINDYYCCGFFHSGYIMCNKSKHL